MATVIRGALLDTDPLLLLARMRQQVASARQAGPGESGAGQGDTVAEEALSAADELAAALAALEAQRDQAVEAGYQHGYDEGLRQGREEGERRVLEADARRKADHEKRMAALQMLIESAHSALDEAMQDSEDALVEIAFTAVCKILGEAMAERAGVLAVIRQVTQQARERERMVVRVSPKDLALIEADRLLLQESTQATTLELVADARVALGGCLVESSGGTLDGRLETQLDSLRTLLRNTRAGTENG